MKSLLLNTHLSVNFNPFGGVSADEIKQVIVPRFDLDQTMQTILDGNPKVIELVGAKGRGKTTHLLLLHQLSGGYPIFLLKSNADYSKIESEESDIIFIDSIHHLSFSQRLRLYKTKKTIVLTTHWSKKLEYKFAGKPSKRISLKGIDADILKEILTHRIRLASTYSHEKIEFKEAELTQLLRKFKDDYRGILNYLYDRFQIEK